MRGRVEVDLLAQKAAARGVKPAIIWHSGKLRAKQTAEAFWRRCNPLSTFAAVRGLQPPIPPLGSSTSLHAELGPERAQPARDIMLVGHFPQMPRLLAHCSAARRTMPLRRFPLNGMVALENVDGRWIESWRMGA